MNTVLLIQNENALAAMAWACYLTGRVRGKLNVIVMGSGATTELTPVHEPSDDSPELLKQVIAHVAAQEFDVSAIYDCRAFRQKRAALNAIAELEAGLLIMHARLSGEARQERSIVRDLARAAPVDTLVLDVDESTERPERVVFAQLHGSGAHGIRFALRAFCDEEHPLLVLPDPSAEARSRRTVAKVQQRLGSATARAMRVLESQDSIDSLIQETVSSRDLVLVDSEDPARVPARLRYLQKLRDDQPEARFAIGVTRTNSVVGPGMLERANERFHRYLPKLDRESRLRISTELERGGRISLDFVIMLMLSAGIAALGLVQNSTAVVIGGMLVAPLMTPMLAAGLSLVQGNAPQFRESLRAMAIGIGGALGVAMVVGQLSPWSDLSSEIVARGAPNLFDLGIAALSGIAAAYSLSRPGLAGTLVGVAVAVALVPPLCSVGISLVKGHVDIALGAAVLFITNLLAIILGAALVFRLFGLDISLRGNQAPRWVRIAMLTLGIALLPVAGVLFSNLSSQIHEGVQRSYSRPLPPALRDAINRRVARSPGIDVLIMEQSGIEQDFDMHIALVVTGAPDPDLAADLRGLVAGQVGADHRVSILMLRGAPD